MAGPAPGPDIPTCAEACGHYVWSGNWAAVIGIVLCLAILGWWFQMKSEEWDEEQREREKDAPWNADDDDLTPG